MIHSLTSQQEARFSEFRDKWLKIGLSTQPADRPKAEEGVRLAYAAAGLLAPRIVWCGSPFSQGLTRAITTQILKDGIGDSVWDSVWDSVRDSVWASVWDSVGDSVWDSVGASVRDSVGDSVGASVRASVWDSVGASVRDSVRDSVGASVRASVRDSGYGQHDAAWLGFYDYFKEACGLTEQTKKLDGLWAIAQNGGWFLPHEKICWISERHCVVELDDAGQLHCETGPAVAYPDGWKLYAIHGVRDIPEWVILQPELITAEKIEEQSNIEIRRIMIERMGHDRYLHETGAQVIDMDSVPIGGGIDGAIIRGLLRDKYGLQFLCGHDGSTERVYYMSVDPEAKTCQQAHKSICGFADSKIIANA